MNILDFHTLMLPVLHFAAQGEVKISDKVEQLACDFNLTSEERAQLLSSGKQTTVSNRFHWAKSYLGKAGLVELTKRTYFRVTARGREVLTSPPERIDIKYLNQFPGFQKLKEEGAEVGEASSSNAGYNVTSFTPYEVMRSAHRQLEVALADEMLQRIRSGIPASFGAKPLFKRTGILCSAL